MIGMNASHRKQSLAWCATLLADGPAVSVHCMYVCMRVWSGAFLFCVGVCATIDTSCSVLLPAGAWQVCIHADAAPL